MRNSYLRGDKHGTHRQQMHADQQALAAANEDKAQGSSAAVKNGCQCDPAYNRDGLGCRRDVCGARIYSVSSKCGMHAKD